jgi:hypothetical protein
MAYQLDRFNGTFLVNVEDGSIETNSTDIRFVGKNYAGYGEVQNENFLHLLENFANTTPPPKKITGQIWYDSGTKKLKFYDGSKFRLAGGAEVATTAPSGLQEGEFWWDTTSKQLYTWAGTEFVLVGPESSLDLGTAAAIPQVVKGTDGANYTILKLFSAGTVVGVISNNTFELDRSLNPINNATDFQFIKKGYNLVGTNSVGVSQNDYIYWGTASNSLKLGGVDAVNYVQKGNITFDQEIRFLNPGFQLGNDNELRVRINENNELLFENRLGKKIVFQINVDTTQRRTLIIDKDSASPGATLIYDLGAANAKWKSIYAGTVEANLVGNVTGDTTGRHLGNVVSPSDSTILINASTKQIGYDNANLRGVLNGTVVGNVTGTASNASKLIELSPSISVPGSSTATIPIRDSSGDIYANNFVGIASKANRLKIDDSAVDVDSYRSAKTTATANTIAARDSSGNISAALFDGTATAARYADLAEKYLPDDDYDSGTVMSIGGEKEITASKLGDRAIGVISANPAFMMNKELEGGVYVALKGRVPVKVYGAVKKGDRLVAFDNGTAKVADSFEEKTDVFAVALESSDEISVKLIESVII